MSGSVGPWCVRATPPMVTAVDGSFVVSAVTPAAPPTVAYARCVTIARAPIFGRDVPDAAWRPTPELLADSRLASLLRATGVNDLERLQARAVEDPAWFWLAAVGDLALDWQRPPLSTIELARGPEWATWWAGGAFNHATAATVPRAARDADGEAIVWEGEDGSVRRLTNSALKAAVERAARMF